MSVYIMPSQWPALTEEVTSEIIDVLSQFEDPTDLTFAELPKDSQRRLAAALLEDWQHVDVFAESLAVPHLIHLLSLFLQGAEIQHDLKDTLVQAVADSNKELLEDFIRQIALEKMVEYKKMI